MVMDFVQLVLHRRTGEGANGHYGDEEGGAGHGDEQAHLAPFIVPRRVTAKAKR